jgi:hypothetical protein
MLASGLSVDQFARYQKLRGKQGTKDLHVEQTNPFQEGVKWTEKRKSRGKAKSEAS